MDTIDVFLGDEADPERVGRAFFTRKRGRVSTVFAYDMDYLAGGGVNIDPGALSLVSGSQAITSGILPAFSDAAPDRWWGLFPCGKYPRNTSSLGTAATATRQRARSLRTAGLRCAW
ncbi:hypothetical protein CCYS_03195 [Corynebacterium cystitidis DSM 20524]|uniref:Uncharacterized protein n=1 Tax=Corynebacterium cystitidis DSM 20524 TaxID=1121357 RepID=A0A1H9QZ73_9CORY|nr:hypothetical protein CCYS_03195 [Corynebacterium cystitidis DSM 20524]SER65752.1 hypothetical protein SAMN05661109_00720 [Corynebacterium cystitidis DSM 20524]SNV85713.1 Uncharacterised protein [Corynebacterium cystitidis]